MIDRRDFLKATSGITLGLCGLSCATSTHATGPGATAKPPPDTFAYLEVSGTPHACGKRIGEAFRLQIQAGMERRSTWLQGLIEFMKEDPANRYQPFLSAAREHLPHLVEELEGLAAGTGIEFQHLFTFNIKAELETMRAVQNDTPGCSTLAYKSNDSCLLTHNEDGDRAYADLMFFVKVAQPGKPAFLSLCYPGILPGNGPCLTEAGLILTTNYIASRTFHPGVPRYFISRAMLQASDLDEALTIATHPERAYAFHYNLASISQRRILSVETSVDRAETHHVDGLYAHTNHFVLPSMRDVAQDAHYVATSSMPRYEVLSEAKEALNKKLDAVSADDLLEVLSSHQGEPYSPCRHPTADVAGKTIAASMFDITCGTWQVYPGNPCRATPFLLDPFSLV